MVATNQDEEDVGTYMYCTCMMWAERTAPPPCSTSWPVPAAPDAPRNELSYEVELQQAVPARFLATTVHWGISTFSLVTLSTLSIFSLFLLEPLEPTPPTIARQDAFCWPFLSVAPGSGRSPCFFLELRFWQCLDQQQEGRRGSQGEVSWATWQAGRQTDTFSICTISDNLHTSFGPQSPLKSPVALGAQDTLTITLTAKDNGKAKRPHQAFVLLKDEDTGLEAPFPLNVRDTGKGNVKIVRAALYATLAAPPPPHLLPRPVLTSPLLCRPRKTSPSNSSPPPSPFMRPSSSDLSALPRVW